MASKIETRNQFNGSKLNANFLAQYGGKIFQETLSKLKLRKPHDNLKKKGKKRKQSKTSIHFEPFVSEHQRIEVQRKWSDDIVLTVGKELQMQQNAPRHPDVVLLLNAFFILRDEKT